VYYKDRKSANVQKRKIRGHRNVLVFFFAFAMLVVLNSQKLSLRELSICALIFGLRRVIALDAERSARAYLPHNTNYAERYLTDTRDEWRYPIKKSKIVASANTEAGEHYEK
jgi:hypothetical protein